MSKFKDHLNQVTTAFIARIDAALPETNAGPKIAALMNIRADIEQLLEPKVQGYLLSCTMLVALAVVGFLSVMAVPPLASIAIGAVTLAGSGLCACRSGFTFTRQQTLSNKIDTDISRQIDVGLGTLPLMEAQPLLALKQKFQAVAGASERYEKLRSTLAAETSIKAKTTAVRRLTYVSMG